MHISFYIARRYLFSKKSKNAINYITAVSVVLVAVVSLALIVAMSVFNGLSVFITSMFNMFDPELKLSHSSGDVFIPDSSWVRIEEIPSIVSYSEILEADVLLSYSDKQMVGKIKGVSENYMETSHFDSLIVEGDSEIFHDVVNYVIVGQGIAYDLSIGLHFRDALHIYAPKRTSSFSINPSDEFNRKRAYAKALFAVQQDIDHSYIIAPLQFTRELLDFNQGEITSVELTLHDKAKEKQVVSKIKEIVGDEFVVQNRNEQHAFLNKITQTEKLITFLIVSFILIIASFSILGAITMLMIEKHKDIQILKSMGADALLIKRIFIIEGWIISVIGAIIGVTLGVLLAYIQQQYGIIGLSNVGGSFVTDAYPVKIEVFDIMYVFAMVLFVGFLAAYYPVKFMSKKYI
ncbi:MAG: FtsX-like permease family protein [Bacteroidales bacterium]